jgi:hypothetical protein
VAERLKEALPSREELRQGWVDPHEEARRMVKPCIEGIDPELATACGVKMTGKKVSRDGATKIWKIMGRLLGEHVNIERLRR